MKIASLIELAKAVQEFEADVNNISACSDGPEILLHSTTFLELFQTFDEERLLSDNGDILKARVCGVLFKAVIYDSERKEMAS